MSVLYLVRHGQAQFMTDDYDRLSEQGQEQSRLLGQHWIANDVELTHAFSGTLRRQASTAAAVGSVYAAAGSTFPGVDVLPGLDEYPADELMQVLLPVTCERDARVADDAQRLESAEEQGERYRLVHRLLEAVMRTWVEGDIDVSPHGLPSWQDWSAGVREALSRALSAPSGSSVAVFTSGGPIGVAVQTLLDAPQIKAAELNWRVANASVTQVTFSAARRSLDGFNDVAHLPRALRSYR